jgi:serine/threonine-protein kinase
VSVESAVLTALEKLPADRFDGAAAFAAALRGETPPRVAPVGEGRARRRQRLLLAGGWGTAAVLAALLAVAAARRPGPIATAGGGDVRRFTITLPDSAPLAVGTNRPALALTPDGGSMVYVARIHGEPRVMVKDLRSDSLRALAGGSGGTGPFIDPAGRAAGFFVGWDLVVSPVAGGASRRLDAVTPVTRGASWMSDSTVAVAADPNSGVVEIPWGLHRNWYHTLAGDSQRSGPPSSRAWPEMLVSEGILLTARSKAADADQWEILARDLAHGTERVVVEGGSNPRYAASGHLLFVRENAIWAVPFDPGRLTAGGRPALIQPAVMTELDGLAHYAIAANGTLVYAAGGEWRSTRRLVWVSPDGSLEPLGLPFGTYNGLALAPDGRRVALTRGVGNNYDVWLGDLARGTVLPITRDPGEDGAPIWAPDGRRLAIGTEFRYGGPPKLALLELGSGALRIEGDSGLEFGAPTGWSRHGGLVFFESRQVGIGAAKMGKDISVLDLATGRRRLWLQTPDNEHSAVPSPDGTLVAYVSDESGQPEVYLRALGGGIAPLPVSSGGGREPHWAATGRTLFFRQRDRILSVRVAGDAAAPDLSRADTAFRLPASLVTDVGFTSAAWDLAPSGRRLLAIDDVARVPVTTLHVVLNLFDELRRRAPAGR